MTEQLLPEDPHRAEQEASAHAEDVPAAPGDSSSAPEPLEKGAAGEDEKGPNPVGLAAGVVGLVVVIAAVVAVPMLMGRFSSAPAEVPAADAAIEAPAASDEQEAPAEGDGAEAAAPSDDAVETNGMLGPDGAPMPSEPIMAEGAGYAFAGDVLAAMVPGLAPAVAAPDDAAVMDAWAASALTLMPADYVAAWAAEVGADSADALAARLHDDEVGALAAAIPSGSFALEQGDALSADERHAIEERFAALGLERFLQAAYHATAVPVDAAADGAADAPGGAADAADDAAAVPPVDTPYCVVKISDAWYLFPTTFAVQS